LPIDLGRRGILYTIEQQGDRGMRRLKAIAAALAACTALVPAGAATVVVTAARMVDVLAGRELAAPQVTIVDGRITAVGHQGDPVPQGATRIDLGNRTLLPGLIDMHVHLTSDPTLSGYQAYEYTDSFWMVVGVSNAKKTLEAGFTTVRNVGSDHYDDVALKEGIEHGYIPGPRIVPATYILGVTGGHGDFTEFPPSIETPTANIANSPDEFRALVRKVHKYGAEVIKVAMTGGVLSKGDSVGAEQVSPAEIQAIVDEAHRLGMRVAVHAHDTEGINDALRAGVDTIEHASLADAESFQLAKQHGAWFDMDIYNDDYILAEGAKNGVFPESMAKEKMIGLKQRQTFKAAHAAGVKMLFGTDGGVYPNGLNARQFATMVQWGMTPIEAIQASTRNAAEALDKTKDVGAIEVGRYGDLIAVDGDPLQDVVLLQHPSFVMKGGEVVKAP
jgi:imidazolonepropionase-like amidohydrolase